MIHFRQNVEVPFIDTFLGRRTHSQTLSMVWTILSFRLEVQSMYKYIYDEIYPNMIIAMSEGFQLGKVIRIHLSSKVLKSLLIACSDSATIP